MDKNILIYIQEKKNDIEPVSLELLGKAREFSHKTAFRIYAVCFGQDAKKTHRLICGYPVEKLFYYETQDLCLDINVMADATARLCEEIRPEVFLIGATRFGRGLAPCIAARLGTGLTADCTELQINKEGELLQIRPAFEEKMLAYIKTRTRPQMATVRPGIMNLTQRDSIVDTELIIRRIGYKESVKTHRSYEILSQESMKNDDSVNISEEKLLVVAGAGVADREDIEVLGRWAESMGGTIACSRKLVERGWLAVERQVGLSGNASKADLMITVGVSGSVQFQAGIHNVKCLIAINTDQDAPIMALADSAILLDIRLFIQALKERQILNGIDS